MTVQLNGADLITSFGDYEEGTFTPGVADNSLDGSGESQTYSIQLGRYTKIGNQVFIQIRVRPSSLGCLTTSNACRIVGLPFVSSDVTNNFPSVCVGNGGTLSIPSETSLGGHIVVNGSYIEMKLWDNIVGATSLLLSELSDDGMLMISAHYEV